MSTYTAELQGLAFSSGSLVRVVLESDSQLRHHLFHFSSIWKMVQLKVVQQRELFLSISHHPYDAEGADSHLWLLIKLIVHGYAVCCVRKIYRDMPIRRGKDGLGNNLAHKSTITLIVLLFYLVMQRPQQSRARLFAPNLSARLSQSERHFFLRQRPVNCAPCFI